MDRSLLRNPLLVAAAVAVVAGCAGASKRDLYADVEIGVRFGFEAVSDLSTQELASRDACAQVELSKQPGAALVSEATQKACKPVGTYMTRSRAAKANDTLGGIKTAARLAVDTTSGCVQPPDAQGATALEKLGLSGCVTSDQVLIAALAAVRLLRQNLEE